MMRASAIASCGLALLLAGWSVATSASAKAGSQQQRPRKTKVEEGLASWYGREFHGKATASGEAYDMHALTAAHRTLPLGTLVEVKNLENGRSLVARINDRGPVSHRRIVDLSQAAAQELGIDRTGVARVRLTVVGAPGDPAPRRYWIEVGAFKHEAKARSVLADLEPRYPGTILREEDGRYQVRVPSTETKRAAEALRRDLERAGYDATILRQPKSNT
jgi:rare lipoprotein A